MEASFHPYLGALLWISFFLAMGTLLRAKIGFLQRFLVPSSLIGGVLGFIFMNLGLVGMPTSNGWVDIPTSAFSTLTFHLFAFGFVGVGLMKSAESNTSKMIARGGLWMALMFSFCWSIQGVIGKSIFELWHMISGADFNSCLGYLIGSGFAQGPGQAHAYGTMWESSNGVANAISTGLASAAMGFVVAVIIGVPMAYHGIKKGWINCPQDSCLPEYFVRGTLHKDEQTPCAYGTTHTATIDNFAFHTSIMGILYACAYCFGLFWTVNMPKAIAGLGFGILFTWGMVFAMILRMIMTKMNCFHMIDQFSVRRITNSSVDFMVCAVFLGINTSDLQDIVVPFLTTGVVAGLVTLVVIMWFARRFENFNFERGIAIFGNYTGTVATGMLLLRIVDPDFKSPAAVEMGVMNVIILATAAPLTYGYPFVPVEGFPMFGIMLGYIVLTPIIMYVLKMIKKPSW